MYNAKSLVRQENALLVTILRHIKEIDRRRLCAKYKQPGLLELVMHEFGYSRDQALRRIQAMRMMRENPVVETKLECGEINLTTVGIVQVLFSHEKREGTPLSREEKLNVIESVSGKSTREAQKIVLSLCSTPPKLNEKVKMIAPDLYEVTAVVDEETKQILDQLRGVLAHSHPNISNGELLKILAKMGLKELQPVKSVAASRPDSRGKRTGVEVEGDPSVVSPRPNLQNSEAVNSVVSPRPNSKAEVRRQVWNRDDHKCSNCGSTYAVQEDHRWPKAKGGPYTVANMRLLCRSCNQHAAIEHFGVQKMERYLSPS